MRAALTVAVLLVVSTGATVARAETCPDVPDDEVALRRSMAKEWFAKAEESEAAGDRQAAVRRYACSLNLAPHPSTAYNLGAVAEKSGDLSMALDGFRTYLKLATEATDRPAIEARIATLEAKMSELRKIAPKPNQQATATPPATVTPPPTVTRTPPPPADDGTHGRTIAAWVTVSGGAAALGTGIVLNVLARSKMSKCRSGVQKATTPDAIDRALDLCDEAPPLAYGSYVLFGVAGAAALAGAVLFLWTPGGVTSEQGASVALVPGIDPMAGAATLLATGRF
jgi:hypothetical protein